MTVKGNLAPPNSWGLDDHDFSTKTDSIETLRRGQTKLVEVLP